MSVKYFTGPSTVLFPWKEFNTYLLDEWEVKWIYKIQTIWLQWKKQSRMDACFHLILEIEFRLHTTEKLSLDYVNYYLYINLQQKLYYIQPNRLIIVFKNKTYKEQVESFKIWITGFLFLSVAKPIFKF